MILWEAYVFLVVCVVIFSGAILQWLLNQGGLVMFYALVIICEMSFGQVCDLDRAAFAEQSPVIYSTEEQCQEMTLSHLHNTDFSELLKERTPYDIVVECEQASDPA